MYITSSLGRYTLPIPIFDNNILFVYYDGHWTYIRICILKQNDVILTHTFAPKPFLKIILREQIGRVKDWNRHKSRQSSLCKSALDIFIIQDGEYNELSRKLLTKSTKFLYIVILWLCRHQ